MIVNVDVAEIKNTAKKLKTFLQNNKDDYQRVTADVQASKEYWEGQDQENFEDMWNVRGKDMLKVNDTIENYILFLEYSEKQYSNLQSRMRNRARVLPK